MSCPVPAYLGVAEQGGLLKSVSTGRLTLEEPHAKPCEGDDGQPAENR
ncbi:hypothetical protein ACFPIF_03720 [Brevundimonas faecalis]